MNMESPYHAIIEHAYTVALNQFKGQWAFNWTMTYRRDSDVHLFYGRKVPLPLQYNAQDDSKFRWIFRKKSGFITGSISNGIWIPNHRDLYLAELKKDSGVHIYGDFGNAGPCPGHWRTVCNKTLDYKFYLAFENSNCHDYITEKLWCSGLGYGAIPIVMGAPKQDVLAVAPDNSFLHVDDFESPADLLIFAHALANDEDRFVEYLKWQHQYAIECAFRQMGTFPWEVLCRALNEKYNPNSSKVYPDIAEWDSAERECYQNKWIKRAMSENQTHK